MYHLVFQATIKQSETEEFQRSYSLPLNVIVTLSLPWGMVIYINSIPLLSAVPELEFRIPVSIWSVIQGNSYTTCTKVLTPRKAPPSLESLV